MKNSYGLPEAELRAIFERDRDCAYCGKAMGKQAAFRGDRPTVELDEPDGR